MATKDVYGLLTIWLSSMFQVVPSCQNCEFVLSYFTLCCSVKFLTCEQSFSVCQVALFFFIVLVALCCFASV